MTKYLPSIAIVVCFVLINSTQGNDVQLDFMLGDLEPWGAVTLNDGKRVELRCIAKNADSKGRFEWKIDDELQKSDRPIRDMGSGVFEQSLEINTAIDLDQKEVECRYIDEFTGEALQETFLTINVIHQKWPEQPFNAGEFEEGESVTLTVPFELYPAPESDLLTWKITDKMDQAIELKPGESDVMSHFQAQKLEQLGANKYNAILTIDSVTKNDAASSIQFIVETDPKNPSHNVDVTFTLRLKKDPKTAETPAEPAEEQAPASQMGIGVWIIVAIIILIAAIIIGYCVYQKKCAKNSNENNDGYQPPKDQREAENQ